MFEASKNVAPDFAGTWVNIGVSEARLGNSEKARKAFEKAIQLEPGYSEPYFNIGAIHFNKGEKKLAIEWFLKTVEVDWSHVKAQNNLGAHYYFAGEYEKSALHFGAAMATGFSVNPVMINSLMQKLAEKRKERFKRSN